MTTEQERGGMTRVTSELTDDLIGRYWDQTRIGADRYPDDATREYHRANYIKAVRANPEALAQITLLFSGGTGLPCQMQGEIHDPHGLCPGEEDEGMTEEAVRVFDAIDRQVAEISDDEVERRVQECLREAEVDQDELARMERVGSKMKSLTRRRRRWEMGNGTRQRQIERTPACRRPRRHLPLTVDLPAVVVSNDYPMLLPDETPESRPQRVGYGTLRYGSVPHYDFDGNPIEGSFIDVVDHINRISQAEPHRRSLANTTVYRRGVRLMVSTVWLHGIDHSHSMEPGGPAVLWETMIFHGGRRRYYGSGQESWRWASEGAARRGHRLIVRDLRYGPSMKGHDRAWWNQPWQPKVRIDEWRLES